MDYLRLPLAQIHQALVEGKITPLDLAKEALRRAKESKSNAFEILLEEQAIAFASTLTSPEPDNLLWGIPYLAKDNFSTKGIPTTASSNILVGYRPVFDATVIARLKQKKCVLIGKTTLDELGMGGSGATGHLGKTFNPYDPSHTHIIGGSSSGSCAAVAEGIVPFALGSDTGDSVRKPASYGGVIGLKPTWGRISRYGLFPFAPSLDHVGFFTRHAEDAAILLEALSGHDERDVTSSPRPKEDFASKCKQALSRPRIAVLTDVLSTIKDETILHAFEDSIKKLEGQGCIVDRIAFGKELLEAICAAYIVISSAEATSNNANLDGIKFGPFPGGNTYQDVMRTARTKGFSSLTKKRFVIGSFCLMKENQEAYFLCAQKARAKIVSRTVEILSDHDFIFVPAAPTVAPRFDQATDKLMNENRIADNHLILGNFAGLPSITLPLGYENGLPFGANFMGRAFEEGSLLAMARTFESLTGLGGACVYGEDK